MAQPPATEEQKLLSQQIRVARTLCILGLVLIHVPPWHVELGDPPRAVQAFDLLFIYMQELFGRASVPLLSLISGYLLVKTTAHIDQRERLRRKVKTLIVPMLLWNMVAVLLGVVVAGKAPSGLFEWANALFALTEEPAIHPLYFLRDMFLCALLYPLIATTLRTSLGWTLGLVTLATVSGLAETIFIGSGPLMFFTFGIAAAQGRLPALPPQHMRAYLVLGTLLAAALATWIQIEMLRRPEAAEASRIAFSITLISERVLGALTFWLLAGFLVRRPWGKPLAAIEGYIFFIFCSHVLWLSIAWKLFEAIGGSYDHPLYPLFFVSAPFTSLIAGIMGAEVMRRLSPPLTTLMCGGRIPPEAGWRRILSSLPRSALQRDGEKDVV